MFLFSTGERMLLGDDADLGAADMHAIAMADGDIGVDVEPDQFLLRVSPCGGSAPRGR